MAAHETHQPNHQPDDHALVSEHSSEASSHLLMVWSQVCLSMNDGDGGEGTSTIKEICEVGGGNISSGHGRGTAHDNHLRRILTRNEEEEGGVGTYRNKRVSGFVRTVLPGLVLVGGRRPGRLVAFFAVGCIVSPHHTTDTYR